MRLSRPFATVTGMATKQRSAGTASHDSVLALVVGGVLLTAAISGILLAVW